MLAETEPAVPLLPIWTVPALLVSGPVKVLAPVNNSVPVPDLPKPPAPMIGAGTVSV